MVGVPREQRSPEIRALPPDTALFQQPMKRFDVCRVPTHIAEVFSTCEIMFEL